MSYITKTVQPSGCLDRYNSALLRQEINNFVENGADIIIVDFTNVQFMDSSGLGTLLSTLKDVGAAGSKMVLCGLNVQLKVLFEITNLYKAFEIYEQHPQFNN